MDADSCIFFQLSKASQAGARFWANAVSRYHLTAVQAMVVNFLGLEDRITSHELGKRTVLDSATLTGILDRLETAGVLERRKHPNDRRAILVCLTDEGRQLAGNLLALVAEANRDFLSGLTPGEQKTLRHLLRKVRESCAAPAQK